MNSSRPRSGRVALVQALVLAPLAGTACAPDSVAPGYYAAPDDPEAGASMIAPTAAPEPTASSSALPGGHDASAADSAAGPSMGPCDLTGRWLVTDREVVTALGSVEAAHYWRYYELTQAGSQVTVAKGLLCGGNVRGISSVSANTDYQKTWPAMMAKDVDAGRKGTSTPTSSGCQVSFEKHYLVIGATVPFYDDASQALPTASEQATSGTPGWEDWDQDGNPGYTMNVTGLVTGQLYMATRSWATWSGSVASVASTFTLSDDWDSDQSVLGINGPSLLNSATSGVKDSDATLHFAQFARLDASQATGADASICDAVRSLAATLTPTASN